MDSMLSALIVSRRSELARCSGFEFDTVQIAVKRQIEIEPSLLAVGDHIQPGRDLILNRDNDRVILHLRDVVPGQRHSSSDSQTPASPETDNFR